MAKVTGFTAARMLEIERSSIISAAIEGGDELVFYSRGGDRIRAGAIKGGTAEWIEQYRPIIDAHEEIMAQVPDDLAELHEKVKDADEKIDQATEKIDVELPKAMDKAEAAQRDALASLQKVIEAAKDNYIEYAVGTSATVPPVDGWTIDTPVVPTGSYAWMRTVIIYGNDTTATSAPVRIQGDPGAKGSDGLQGLQGPSGEQGIPGKDGKDGLTSYTHIAYADTATGSGFSQSPTNKAYIGMYYDFEPDDDSDPSKYAWSLIKGADGTQGIPGTPGADGKTPYFHTAWANSADGTSGFSTTVSAGKSYLGTYTDFVKEDSTTPSKYSWSLIKGEKGDTGDKGADGIPGKDGVGLTKTDISYAKSASGTVSPSTGWGTTVPASTPGQFLWTRTVWTYSDGSTETGYSVAMWGATGSKGDTGNDGIAGKDGVGIKSTVIEYAKSTSGTTTPTTGWGTTVPAATPGQYLWTRTVWTYTDNTTETGYSVAMWGTAGSKGDTGDTGISVTSVVSQYKLLKNLWGGAFPSKDMTAYGVNYSTRTQVSGGMLVEVTGVPTSAYSLTYTSGGNRVPVIAGRKYSWRLPFKNVGSTDTPIHVISWIIGGVSAWKVLTLKPGESTVIELQDMTTTQEEDATVRYSLYYAASETKPQIGDKILVMDGASVVEGLNDPEGWFEQEPAYEEGYVLYKREKITYSNGQIAYTTATGSSSYQAAENALYVANFAQQAAEGLVHIGPEAPEHGTGKVWIQTGEFEKEDGTTIENRIMSIYQSVDGEWLTHTLMTSMLIVANPDGPPTIIDENGIVVGEIQAEAITGTEIAADSIVGKHIYVGSIPKTKLDKDLETAIDESERVSNKVLIDDTSISIVTDKGVGESQRNALTMTSDAIQFLFNGNQAAYIKARNSLMYAENLIVGKTIQIGEHQLKSLGSNNITIVQWTGAV